MTTNNKLTDDSSRLENSTGSDQWHVNLCQCIMIMNAAFRLLIERLMFRSLWSELVSFFLSLEYRCAIYSLYLLGISCWRFSEPGAATARRSRIFALSRLLNIVLCIRATLTFEFWQQFRMATCVDRVIYPSSCACRQGKCQYFCLLTWLFHCFPWIFWSRPCMYWKTETCLCRVWKDIKLAGLIIY